MIDLLERLRRDDPSALEEIGHRLLPFAHAAVLAQTLTAKNAAATLQAFRESVAVAPTANAAEFAATVVRRMREAASTLADLQPDPAQASALQTLARLRPMPVSEREWAVARFVERLPAETIAAQFKVEMAVLAVGLARGAELLVGPAPGGDWLKEPSLTDPNASPAPLFVELENQLTPLAIDVTALEHQPLKAALPAPLQSPTPAHDEGRYPSKVHTQGAVDLPAQVSPFVAAAARAPTPKPQGTHAGTAETLSGLAPVSQFTPRQAPALRRSLAAPDEDTTVPRGRPLKAPVSRGRRPRFGYHPTLWWSSAGACAVLGLGMYWLLITRVEAKSRFGWPLVPVIVATRDLPEGQSLTFDMLATRAVPEAFVTSSVVKPESTSYVLGQTLSVPLQAGDNLEWAQFESYKAIERLARKVTPSLRAYSIPVSELKAVGGWLLPGESADLVLTMKGDEHGGESIALTLLQDVKVMAVGATTSLTVGTAHLKFTTLSLLLHPQEAEVLALAGTAGSLTATLRTAGDNESIKADGATTLKTLIDGIRIKAIERKRFETIQAIRGGAADHR